MARSRGEWKGMRVRRSGVDGGVLERLRGPWKGPKGSRHGGWRVSVAVFSLGLVLAALAAPAGAANGDPGSACRARKTSSVDRPGVASVFHLPGGGGPPAARVAASGRLTPAAALNGFIDAANSAVGATGPGGFVLGASLFLVKEYIGSTEAGDEAQDASEKLTEIGDQLTALKKQLGDAVFAQEVEKTRSWITKIEETEKDLRCALLHAKKADDKGLSAQQREGEETAFITAKAEFIDSAHELVKDKVAADLNTALINHQEAGTPTNPKRKAALLPQLRRDIAGERFLTPKSSATIREFFNYYEWWQVRLGAVLSEYYMLGGPCAWTSPPKGCKEPPKPDPVTVKERIEAIKDDIETQRRVAGLPAKYLDQTPLLGKVFIDTHSSLMWGIEPAFRTYARALEYGIFSGCGVQPHKYREGDTCNLDAHNQFAGYSNWGVPTLEYAQGLLARRGSANPIAWLTTVDVTFNNPGGVRFPGYVTSRPIYLWVRDGWTLSAPQRGSIFDKYTRTIYANMVMLATSVGNPLASPEVISKAIGNMCAVHQSLSPYYPIYRKPECNIPGQSEGGFVLWVRFTSAAERKDYYVTPPPS
jgi:hypothetical protein